MTEKQEKPPVFVISWRYYDGSDSGMLPYAFTNREEAARMFSTLTSHSEKQWYFNELEIL